MQEFVNKVAAGDKEVPVDVLYPPAMTATAMLLTAARFYIIATPLITKDSAKEFTDPQSPF